MLTVRDADGDVIRHIEGPVKAGFHRVAWDLRYPHTDPWKPEGGPRPWRLPAGVLVTPGTYNVSLGRRIDGRIETVGARRSFEVVSIRDPTLERATQAERVAFSRRADELNRAVAGSVSAIDETVEAIEAIKKTLLRSTAAASLYEAANAIARQARQLRDRLATNDQRSKMGDPGPMSVGDRISAAADGARSSAYGPTVTQARNLDLAEEEFADVGRALDRLIDEELGALKNELDAAGVPWSPGRGVPAVN